MNPHPTDPGVSSPPRLIVISDDEGAIAWTQKAGKDVWLVESSPGIEEGRLKLRTGDFEAVLFDAVVIPPGGEAAALGSLTAEFPHVPVLMLAAARSSTHPADWCALGAQDALPREGMAPETFRSTVGRAVERHAFRQKLVRRSEDRFRHLIERSADGMVVVDKRGVVCYLNPAVETIFERRANELVGRRFDFNMLARQGLPSDGPLDDLSLKYVSLLARTSKTTELEISLGGDVVKLVEMRATDIAWEGEESFLVVFHDITSLMRLQRLKAEIFERERVSKLKDEFISTVSHELRTPLAIVKCAVENMKDGITGEMNERQERVIKIASANVDRLTKLIDDILDLSRLEAGKTRLSVSGVAIGQIVEDAVRRFNLLARDHGLALESELAGDLPEIQADADKIVQVVDNLIGNALRYARRCVVLKGRTLKRALTDEGEALAERLKGRPYLSGGVEGVVMSVIDDGPGIPEDKLTYLFNKFVQIDRPSGGSGYMGTGLGLAICKEIVELHDGVIWVENRPGGGAGFHFVLPRSLPATAKVRSDGAEAGTEKERSGYEDEETHSLGG